MILELILTCAIWTAAERTDHVKDEGSVNRYYGPGIFLAWIAVCVNDIVGQEYPFRHRGEDPNRQSASSLNRILYVLPAMVDAYIQSSRNVSQYNAALTVIKTAAFFRLASTLLHFDPRKPHFHVSHTTSIFFSCIGIVAGIVPGITVWARVDIKNCPRTDKIGWAILMLAWPLIMDALCINFLGKSSELTRDRKLIMSSWVLTWSVGMMEIRDIIPKTDARISDLDQFTALVSTILLIAYSWRVEILALLQREYRKLCRIETPSSVGQVLPSELEAQASQYEIVEVKAPSVPPELDSRLALEELPCHSEVFEPA